MLEGDFCMGVISEVLSGIKILEKACFFISNLKYAKYNYYYDFYNRKTYVNSNGDGIIFISCDLVVVNPLKTKEIIINLDISDAKENAKFPDFDCMQEDGLKPFEDFCFKCYSDNGIISRAVESYDSLPTAERKTKKSSKKHICIALKIDTSKVKKNKKYKIRYMFSIPGMFPITNGVWDNKDDNTCECSSYMECNEHFKRVKYSLYLADDIQVNEDVTAKVQTTKSHDELPQEINKKEYMFYNKYITEVKKAQNKKYFVLSWHLNRMLDKELEANMDRLSQK